jgi:hypothetical protein
MADMSIQIPAQAISIWQYIVTHPITWAAIGLVVGDVAGHLKWPI